MKFTLRSTPTKRKKICWPIEKILFLWFNSRSPKTALAPKKMVSEEKWREYYLKRKERIKNDPVLAALEAEKEKKKREKKKALKQVKLVADMSASELRMQREKWRKSSKKCYRKKKGEQRLANYLQANSPPPRAGDADGCVNSGREKVKIGRSKLNRLYKKEREKAEKLELENARLRQRLSRLERGIGSDTKSPREIVHGVLRRGDRCEIRQRLISGEAVKRQLRENYEDQRGRKEKRELGRCVYRVALLKQAIN